jgi:hypothetical protein
MSTPKPNPTHPVIWTGRQQAFALIGGKCALAQAQCLRELRQSRAYQALGLTWAEFCTQHAGMTRAAADRLIQRLNEFGENYFKLSQLVPISPDTYRELAPYVQDETISIHGNQLKLVPENAAAIRAAVQSLRDELRTTQIENSFRYINADELRNQLEKILEEFRRRARHPHPRDIRLNLGVILRYAILEMIKVAEEFDRAPV